MKYKILLITSILATVQFYAHGAEGGAAAATGDLAAMAEILTAEESGLEESPFDLVSVSKALAAIDSSGKPVISPQRVKFVLKPSSFSASPLTEIVCPRPQTKPKLSVRNPYGMYAVGGIRKDSLSGAGKHKPSTTTEETPKHQRRLPILNPRISVDTLQAVISKDEFDRFFLNITIEELKALVETCRALIDHQKQLGKVNPNLYKNYDIINTKLSRNMIIIENQMKQLAKELAQRSFSVFEAETIHSPRSRADQRYGH